MALDRMDVVDCEDSEVETGKELLDEEGIGLEFLEKIEAVYRGCWN